MPGSLRYRIVWIHLDTPARLHGPLLLAVPLPADEAARPRERPGHPANPHSRERVAGADLRHRAARAGRAAPGRPRSGDSPARPAGSPTAIFRPGFPYTAQLTELRLLAASVERLVRRIPDVRRQMREEAAADLARRVAHDIKNALAPIGLAADYIRRVLREPRGRDPPGRQWTKASPKSSSQVERLRRISSEFSALGAPASAPGNGPDEVGGERPSPRIAGPTRGRGSASWAHRRRRRGSIPRSWRGSSRTSCRTRSRPPTTFRKSRRRRRRSRSGCSRCGATDGSASKWRTTAPRRPERTPRADLRRRLLHQDPGIGARARERPPLHGGARRQGQRPRPRRPPVRTAAGRGASGGRAAREGSVMSAPTGSRNALRILRLLAGAILAGAACAPSPPPPDDLEEILGRFRRAFEEADASHLEGLYPSGWALVALAGETRRSASADELRRGLERFFRNRTPISYQERPPTIRRSADGGYVLFVPEWTQHGHRHRPLRGGGLPDRSGAGRRRAGSRFAPPLADSRVHRLDPVTGAGSRRRPATERPPGGHRSRGSRRAPAPPGPVPVNRATASGRAARPGRETRGSTAKPRIRRRAPGTSRPVHAIVATMNTASTTSIRCDCGFRPVCFLKLG